MAGDFRHQFVTVVEPNPNQMVRTTGRQGLFKYNNMDHSIGMGLAAAENLMGRGESHKNIAEGDRYFG